VKTSTKTVGILSLILAISTVLSTGGVCHASPESPESEDRDAQKRAEAKLSFIEGSKSFSDGRYRQAIDQFRHAFDIVRSPEILFNIGRCHEELGEFEEAIYNYEMYLRFFPRGEDSDAVRNRIESLREVDEDVSRGDGRKPLQPKGEDAEADPTKAVSGGIRLGLNIGIAGGVSGPSDGVVVPIDIIASFPVFKWLSITAAFQYGHYFNQTTGATAYSSQNRVGGVVGLRGDWPIIDVLAIMARAGFSTIWFDFGHDAGKTWLAGRLDGGLVWEIVEHWALIADLWIAVGGMVGDEIANTPLADDTPEAEIGFALGVEYIF
jgi:hypothetical protein